mmetsp:Transcript_45104/g.105367  ORF Transcript_45104/g.105367 Transcript_45104/m.105367 type:complete len:145 (+) Transcript_45104:434-868(+)
MQLRLLAVAISCWLDATRLQSRCDPDSSSVITRQPHRHCQQLWPCFCRAHSQDFMERRLQTQVFKLGLAKSIHHARVLIRQRHIRVGKQIVNIPSFMVRTDSQKHIDFSITSPYGGGRPGRNKRKAIAAKGGGGGGGDDDEDME